ncbi:MAG: hypothetical protein AAFR61_18835 [Bacteroidota bacterium]
MTSFRSKHYPKSSRRFAVVQDAAMQYFGAFNIVIMLVVLLNISQGSFGNSLLWTVIIAEILALVLGLMMAYVQLRKRYAEIFFVNQHFSLISVYDIVYEQKQEAFPLAYANPQFSFEQDKITFHYHDQIITLRREDWEDFDLIMGWMSAVS